MGRGGGREREREKVDGVNAFQQRIVLEGHGLTFSLQCRRILASERILI